jgi:hypothetical protein
METVIAACLLVAFLACVAVIGMTLGYNVELTFHPPIFIKLKLTRTGEPESRQVQEPSKTIPIQRKPTEPPEEPSPDENATPVPSDPDDAWRKSS